VTSSVPVKLLGDILSLEYGKPLPQAERTDEQVVPAFGANGILCWARRAYRIEPSIIVGRKGSAGEVNLTNGPYWPTDVTYFVVHDETETDLKFLYYVLKSLDLPSLAKGVKPGINRNDVYALRVPVPHLSEQKNIVTILGEIFEGIAKATVNAERKLLALSELKSAVLNRALLMPQQNTGQS
jgi:type I restriction enzyme, S subunit